MIKIRGVNKKFNDFVALEDINIDIEKGTIHGIIGENGAGKTTLLQMLARVYTVDEGKLLQGYRNIFEEKIDKNVLDIEGYRVDVKYNKGNNYIGDRKENIYIAIERK